MEFESQKEYNNNALNRFFWTIAANFAVQDELIARKWGLLDTDIKKIKVEIEAFQSVDEEWTAQLSEELYIMDVEYKKTLASFHFTHSWKYFEDHVEQLFADPSLDAALKAKWAGLTITNIIKKIEKVLVGKDTSSIIRQIAILKDFYERRNAISHADRPRTYSSPLAHHIETAPLDKGFAFELQNNLILLSEQLCDILDSSATSTT